MARPEWVEVGRIARPHGVRGEVRVSSDTDNPERFAPGSTVYGRRERTGRLGLRPQAPSGGSRPEEAERPPEKAERLRLTIETVRGDSAFPIVAFAEVGDRDQAEALRGFVLEVPGAGLPALAEDEFYPFELIGLEVRDGEGGLWGRVVDVVDVPAHPLLVVTPGAADSTLGGDEAAPRASRRKDEVLVPFVKEAVPVVSPAEGYLQIEPRFLEQP